VNTPPVYLIDANLTAHHVPDWETMEAMTGTHSPTEANALVKDIPESLFIYGIGSEIPSVIPSAAATPPPPLVVRAATPPPPPAPSISKLGNADPAYSAWLNSEVTALIGPPSSKAAFSAKDVTFLRNAITARHIPDYYKSSPGDCGAPPQLGSLGIVQEAGSFASLGVAGAQIGASIAKASISALPLVGAAIGIFEAAYQLGFGHHAAAVKAEQNTLCNAVPLANQYMDQLDAAYRKGQLSGAQLNAALEALFAKFVQLVQGIIKPQPFAIQTAEQQHICNAACVYARALRGIIDAKTRFDY
jgi:hypothetical protein